MIFSGVISLHLSHTKEQNISYKLVFTPGETLHHFIMGKHSETMSRVMTQGDE